MSEINELILSHRFVSFSLLAYQWTLNALTVASHIFSVSNVLIVRTLPLEVQHTLNAD